MLLLVPSLSMVLANFALMHDVHDQGGLDADPELWTWTGEMLDRGCRAEIAAWEGRAIFSPEDGHTSP